MNGASRLALAGVAVVAIALGGIYLSNRGPTSGVGGQVPSPTPTPAPSPTAASVPDMNQPFSSPWYGYSLRYPAVWAAVPAAEFFEPVAWRQADGPADWLDTFAPQEGGRFRIASAAVPVGEDGEAWIATNYGDCAADCEDVVIDGQPAQLSDQGGEIEATLVVGQRAYVMTLFTGDGALPNGRAVFDALVATIELDPDSAEGAPSPSPAP